MREQWKSRSAFILAAVGSAAGLGNVWRFPYQAAGNGGGAFLIPYFIALVVVGIPLLIIEFAIGQKYKAGAPTALGKINKGGEILGWISIGISFFVVAYYSVVVAWIFDYLWYSFSLAWTKSSAGAGGFFFNEVLKISDGPFTVGGFSTPVIIGLILAWVSIYLSIKDGAESVGKIVKYTVILPIVLLAIFAVRGLTLPGAIQGINFYLTPDFKALGNVDVWSAAFGQILLSLSIAYGIMIAYASYMPKKSDITLNATITALSNSGISFLSGLAIFGTLGHIAHVAGKEVSEIAGSGGVGLAFVVYPEAISKLPFGLWGQVIMAAAFFIMLLTLGIDSAFSLVEAIVAAIVDKYNFNKKKTTLAVVLAAAACSLIFATHAGLYWLDIVDNYLNKFALIPAAFLQVLFIIIFFKVEKLRSFINSVSDVQVGKWFNYLVYASCISLGFVMTMNIIKEINSISSGKLYEGYPKEAILIGGLGILLVLVVKGFVMTFAKKTENIES